MEFTVDDRPPCAFIGKHENKRIGSLEPGWHVGANNAIQNSYSIDKLAELPSVNRRVAAGLGRIVRDLLGFGQAPIRNAAENCRVRQTYARVNRGLI